MRTPWPPLCRLLLMAGLSLTIFLNTGCAGSKPESQPDAAPAAVSAPAQASPAPVKETPLPATPAAATAPAAAPSASAGTASTAPPAGSSGNDGENAGPALSLEECLRIALAQSPAVDSALKTVEGAQAAKRKAAKDFLPTVGMQYTYTWLDETPMQAGLNYPPLLVTPPRQVGTRDNFKLTTSVSQPIFTGFALTSAYQLAKLGLDVAEITKDQQKMDLVLDVKQAYFAILQAQKSVEVTRQSVKQLEAHLNVAKSFFDVGMVPKNEVLQAEVKTAESVQSRIEAEHALRNAQARMNTLLRRDINEPVAVVDVLTYKPTAYTLGECLERGLRSRPEIGAAEKQIQMKDKEVQLARADYYPSVSVSYNQIQEGDTWDVKGSPYHEPYTWNVVAVAKWNVFEWGKNLDSVQGKKIEKSKAKNTLTQVKDGVRLEVKQSFLALEAAEQAIFVSEKALEQAEENFRMSQERYREQVATATEVTDAETLLTSARTNRYNALYQYNVALATLERAMGARPFTGQQP